MPSISAPVSSLPDQKKILVDAHNRFNDKTQVGVRTDIKEAGTTKILQSSTLSFAPS